MNPPAMRMGAMGGGAMGAMVGQQQQQPATNSGGFLCNRGSAPDFGSMGGMSRISGMGMGGMGQMGGMGMGGMNPMMGGKVGADASCLTTALDTTTTI